MEYQLDIITFLITHEYASWNFSGETKTTKMANWSITKIVNHLSCFKMELSYLKEKRADFEKQMKAFLLPHTLTSTNKLVQYNKCILLKSA